MSGHHLVLSVEFALINKLSLLNLKGMLSVTRQWRNKHYHDGLGVQKYLSRWHPPKLGRFEPLLHYYSQQTRT